MGTLFLPLLAALAVQAATAATNPQTGAEAEAGTTAVEATAPATTDAGSERALVKWRQANRHAVQLHRRSLQVSASARDRLVAALLTPMAADADAAASTSRATLTPAFAAARRMAPRDPLVAWLGALECPAGETARCDADAALGRLQSIQADNAAVWALAATRAHRAGDREQAWAHLHRAAQASRYQLPMRAIGELLYRSLQDVQRPPLPPSLAVAMAGDTGLEGPASLDGVAALEALSLSHAMAVPGYSGLGQLCTAAVYRAEPTHGRDCIALLESMAAADNLLDRNVGLSLLLRMAPNHARQSVWREGKREVRWLMTAAHFSALPAWYPQRRFEQGEVAALRAVLESRGQPLTPPADWRPGDLRGRHPATANSAP